MHVLILPSEHFKTVSSPLGGIFQYHQANALRKDKHKIGILSVGFITPRFVFRSYKYNKTEEIGGIQIKRKYKKLYFPFRFMPMSFLVPGSIKLIDRLYQQYTNEFGEPDVIHAHNIFYAGFLAEYLKKKYAINYIITEHSSTFYTAHFSPSELTAIQRIANHASVFTAVSSRLRNVLKKYIQAEIDLLPNVVDNSFFMADLTTKKDNEFIFLNVASLDANKNQELLIRSFDKLAKSNKNLLLHIAGDGPLKEHLKALTKELQLEKQVKFLGRITAKEVRAEMINSDCFVLSSNHETFGVVLIEALACGLPLVATRSGGPEDIVNEQNGLLVEVKNQNQLQDAMALIFSNKEMYDKMNLRNQAKIKFGEEAFVHNAINYYKKAIYNGK